MSGGRAVTYRPWGFDRKEKTAGPRPWCQQDLDLPLPLYFATTPRSQMEVGGELSGGWGSGEGFVTPAGNGVSVPSRGKFLPSSLQFKLGTKKYVYILFFGFVSLFFVEVLLCVLFFLVERWVVFEPASLSPLPNIVQGGSAWLRPTVVQCCVERSFSPRPAD